MRKQAENNSATCNSRTLNGKILHLAVPAIFNNITVPLLGLADTAIAGHLGDTASLGAIAVGAMMINVVVWLCGFLRAGTAGLSAQANGAGDYALSRNVLYKSFIIAAIISICCILLQRPLAELLLSTMTNGDEVTRFADTYFKILVWGIPAQLGLMAVTGWFIGMQNTVVPMVISVGINLINVALSVALVFGSGMGFAGIPTGTLAANWIGLIAGIWFVVREIRKHPRSRGVSKVRWSRFFSVNRNLFFRSACIMGVSLTVTALGARMGEVVLAGNAVMMQFFLFFSYFMDGFAYAAEALVGHAAGAGNSSELHRTVVALMKWGAAMATIFLLIYAFASGGITSLLTDQAEVRRQVESMWIWVVILPPVTVLAFLFDGIFIGLARTGILFITTLIAAVIFFAVAFATVHVEISAPNRLLWLGFEAYLFARGLSLAYCYKIISRKGVLARGIE
ncbi:MAG: MATE family efflux transporter [Muribaculaceae bacterium]|nr:MATE family efflux transporter [Muribaculaceae bacterium]